MPDLASLLTCMFVFAGVAPPALVLAGLLPLVFVLVNPSWSCWSATALSLSCLVLPAWPHPCLALALVGLTPFTSALPGLVLSMHALVPFLLALVHFSTSGCPTQYLSRLLALVHLSTLVWSCLCLCLSLPMLVEAVTACTYSVSN